MGKFRQFLEQLKWSHVALVIGAGAAFFFYMLDPSEVDMRTQNIEQLKTEMTSLRTKIQEAKDFELQFEDKKRRYAELVKELQKIQGALPKQFFLPDLLSDLLRESKQLEVEMVSIKPDAKETAGDLYNSWGFELELRGTFLQIFIFLDRLANLKRLVSVENFNIARSGEKFMTLGGSDGAFASTKLSGGKTAFPEAGAKVRVITYRYRGVQASESEPPPGAAGGKK